VSFRDEATEPPGWVYGVSRKQAPAQRAPVEQ
jgi:hypothetical protein